MTLDEVAKVAQIAFYVVGGAVAVMTYVSAKRGLLNTVNTEYQKRVMDRLAQLADELYSEFNPSSPNDWMRNDSLKEAVAEVNRQFLENKDAILNAGEMGGGVLVGEDWLRLRTLVGSVGSDPFIPATIRDTVVDLLQNRLDVLVSVRMEVLEGYMKGLASGSYTRDLDENEPWIHNKVNALCYERGCGISQIEDEVHKVRLAIQAYLESFNPLS